MKFKLLGDTGYLNQSVIQFYLSGSLPLHVMRIIEAKYDEDPIVQELFAMQGAKPFHLTTDESEFDGLSIDELLECAYLLKEQIDSLPDPLVQIGDESKGVWKTLDSRRIDNLETTAATSHRDVKRQVEKEVVEYSINFETNSIQLQLTDFERLPSTLKVTVFRITRQGSQVVESQEYPLHRANDANRVHIPFQGKIPKYPLVEFEAEFPPGKTNLNKYDQTSLGELQKAEQPSLQMTVPPAEVPGYRIEKLLGQGAFGQVWLGQTPASNPKTAPSANKKLIVGFGEALVNKFPSGQVVGGTPLNFSLRAAELGEHFGFNAALVTRIGADQDGRLISALLSDSKLELSGLQIDEHLPTGFVHVVSDQNGQLDYMTGCQVAWNAIEFDEAASKLAQRAAVVCFGTLVQLDEISASSLNQFLRNAVSATKILDLNLRKPLPTLSVLNSSLKLADVLKCNLEELHRLAHFFSLEHPTDGSAIAQQLQERFDFQAVFWTRGAEGCCWQSGPNCVVAEVPKFVPEPDADSVGAEDAAGAALAMGLVLDWNPERIVRAANLLYGALAASRRGVTVPLSNEVLQLVDATSH